MQQHVRSFQMAPFLPLILSAFALAACGNDDNNNDDADNTSPAVVAPAAPTGLGAEDTAAIPSGLAYVNTGATNQRNDPCMVALNTNAGARVLKGFLDVWTPSSLLVDAGVTLSAANGCAAVTQSTWTGIPGDATDGTVNNSAVHLANINYVATVTNSRNSAQELAAYLDDRRGKGYSVSDGMGPLTAAWRAGTQQTTTVTALPADNSAAAVNDGGNNIGVGSTSNTNLGLAVDFIGNLDSGSTEPPKRFYKYARPYRWTAAQPGVFSAQAVIAPSLENAKSTTPSTDGGFPSGHTAEAWRDTLTMAYLVPQRYQELVTRAMEMGENRILAGMHSPLDVMGGRIHATAVVAYNLNNFSYYTANAKTAAYNQAQAYLQKQAGVSSFSELNTFAHSGTTSSDRFADYAANKAFYSQRMTYNLPKISATSAAATVPKGAEVLLETRLPYLTAAQRRVVLKTTEIDSGYPLANDDEGWGRLNLFAAADGYGAFNGDVTVTMDAAQGGFSAADSWKNDIAGAGLLTKKGSGVLTLAGVNTWTGGTVVAEGTLTGASANAFGKGDVYVSGGTVKVAAGSTLTIGGKYSQLANGTLELNLGSGSQGRVAVTGAMTIVGGTLHVTFAKGYAPAVGDVLNVITAGSRNGNFTKVTVDGFKATPIYNGNGIQIRIDG
ncbi:MAG: phosphatase PAP2 family protein [Rhodocyclaceae bacterium]